MPLSDTSSVILVIGATGRLGRIVTRDLAARGVTVRILSRRPDQAAAEFGDGVQIAGGDLHHPDSLRQAMQGADRLFLLSPISESLAADQIAAIDAARAAGIGRVVKISGSDWTVGTSFSGDAHQQIEAHLARTIPGSVAIRPNAWAQVSLADTIRQIRETGRFHSRHGAARVSYIDIRDIADVAVAQLLAPRVDEGPLVITGPEALAASDLALLAGRLTGRRIAIADAPPGGPDRAADLPAFERGVIAQFMRVIAAGGAAGITQTVARILGRPPRRVADYLAGELTATTTLS